MHSSRMRTVRCSSRLLGVCLPGGVSDQVGVSVQGDVADDKYDRSKSLSVFPGICDYRSLVFLETCCENDQCLEQDHTEIKGMFEAYSYHILI